MYNHERKAAFIATKNNKTQITNILSQIEKIELALEKDVCEFSLQELQSVFDSNFGTDIHSLSSVRNIFSEYRQWCKDNAYPTNDEPLDLEFYSRQKYLDYYVASAKHLKSRLDATFDDPKACTLDCVFRSYFWFAFIGIPEQQAFDIKVDQVSIEDRTITTEDRQYELPVEALPEISICCTQDSFVYVHTNPDYTAIKQRVQSDTVLRGVRVKKMTKSTISSKLEKKRANLLYSKIRLSGQFVMVRERTYDGFDYKLTLAALANENIIADGRSFKTPTYLRKVANTDKHRLIFEYESWRKTFP